MFSTAGSASKLQPLQPTDDSPMSVRQLRGSPAPTALDVASPDPPGRHPGTARLVRLLVERVVSEVGDRAIYVCVCECECVFLLVFFIPFFLPPSLSLSLTASLTVAHGHPNQVVQVVYRRVLIKV